jgi:putative addiction module component (TIGR02574 family)
MSTDPHRLLTANKTAHCDGNLQAVATAKNVADVLGIAETLTPNDRLRLVAAIWNSLPPSNFSAPSAVQLVELQTCLANYDAGRTTEFPWATVTQLMAGRPSEKQEVIYSVPRRFDLSTIFVVTLAYSLLFGLMSMASFPPVASMSIGGFITLVAVSQAVLFQGKRPRTASLIVGSLIFGCAILAFWFVNGQRSYPAAVFVITGGYTVATGMILGYLSGTIVGGIFLIADKCRNRFARNRDARASVNPRSDVNADSKGDSPWAS